MENIEETLRSNLEDVLGIPIKNSRVLPGNFDKEDFEIPILDKKGQRITKDMISQCIIKFYAKTNESYSLRTIYDNTSKKHGEKMPTFGVNVTYGNTHTLVSVISFNKNEKPGHSDILAFAA